jgi:hypothetical protein
MGVATSGRLNPEGISYLYLAEAADTAIAEVRPWRAATVSVGKFRPNRSLRISSLMFPSSILGSNEIAEHGLGLVAGLMFESLYFSAPTHRDDKHAYLPTQYIAAKFKAAGIDGIQYSSVLRDGGVNTVVFDPSSCKCEGVEVFEVSRVAYEHAQRAA